MNKLFYYHQDQKLTHLLPFSLCCFFFFAYLCSTSGSNCFTSLPLSSCIVVEAGKDSFKCLWVTVCCVYLCCEIWKVWKEPLHDFHNRKDSKNNSKKFFFTSGILRLVIFFILLFFYWNSLINQTTATTLILCCSRYVTHLSFCFLIYCINLRL